MTDGVIWRGAHPGPQAHVMIVGVADYPHLLGGRGPLSRYNDGMGQLTSAAVSARSFAEWLMPTAGQAAPFAEAYFNPQRPLGSVRMLLSEASPAPILTPLGQASAPPATMANFEDTAKGWFGDLEADEGNLAIFYFVGHGVTAGLDEQALLLEDFAAEELDPFKASVRFNRFHLGLDRAAARDQVFFIDACRAHSKEFTATFGGAGQAVIPPSAFTTERSRFRACPVFYATTLGASAYGRPGRMTIFTEALIDALRGGGGDNPDGRAWRIDTSTLLRALDYIVRRTCEREGLERAQNSSGAFVTTVDLSVLNGPPHVPVTLSCRPTSFNDNAIFSWAGNPTGWRITDRDPLIPVGLQQFSVALPGGVVVGPLPYDVRPSYRAFEIDVA